MKDVNPSGRYRRDEMGRKDEFDKNFNARSAYYVGKN
jgi:hypothetical protein